MGPALFTIRNGDMNDPGEIKNYAEKILLVDENQVTPWHFHWQTTGDIINRGGGRLMIRLSRASPDESALYDRPVRVSLDGFLRTVEPRGSVSLGPGEIITIPPRLYQEFHAKP